MASQLRQLSVRSPGSEGLSSEISPFQSSTEFALRADNAVIDRVGRLACREAFADLITQYDGGNANYDVVRLCQIQGEDAIQNVGLAEFGLSEFSTAEYSGFGLDNGIKVDQTFGLMGEGTPFTRNKVSRGAMSDEISTVSDVQHTSYVGFYQEGNVLKTIDAIRPKHGLTNCKILTFNRDCYVFSKGEEVMVWDGTEARKLSETEGYSPPKAETIIAPIIDGDIACAAYGRLWVSGVNGDYQTVYFSDMLLGHQWYDGSQELDDWGNTAGIIDVAEYWPDGEDTITGIAAHNNFLIIFGRKSILLYSGAQGDPAGNAETGSTGIKLEDAIKDVGLVNQDAMCNIGTDHLFVDSLGVRSLGRVIQEKSAPISEPSMNVASLIRPLIATYSRNVRLIHMPAKSLVICLFPAMREAYVFQLGRPSATGGLRATRWTGCDFFDSITVRTELDEKTVLGGRDSRGLCVYGGFKQPTDYPFRYESTVLSGTDTLMQTMIPKSTSYSFHAAKTPSVFNATWGFGADMEYSRPLRNPKGKSEFKTVTTSLNGTGEMLRIGFDSMIEGTEMSMQQITLNILLGRIIV
jgi:hypothetical protein